MTQYYFAATALPPLRLDAAPELNFTSVMFLLETNLNAGDLAALRVLLRFYDLENAKALWRGVPIEPYGNLHEAALREALQTGQGLPGYVLDFLNTYETSAARLRHFPALLAAYYRQEITHASGFLRDYLAFERAWRLVATALRAKQLGRDLADELQYEDPQDDFIAQLLVQRDAASFEPPDGYEELKAIFELYQQDPLELHKALCVYRFEKIETMLGIDLFSIDRILGYVAQLITVEKWFELDHQKGLKFVDAIAKEKL